MHTQACATTTARPHGLCRIHAAAWLALAAALGVGAAQAQPLGRLNDTGQTQCYDGSAPVACTAANAGDASPHPRQDGRFGRDAAGLAKVGGGAAGFDFTRICWNGMAEGTTTGGATCTGTLVANTGASASTTPATDWACTKDNHTNLIWSLEIVGNVTWHEAISTAGGSPIATYNSINRCGFATGWRVLTLRELLSIVHHGVSSPAIDGAYFPGIVDDGSSGGGHWTSDAAASSSSSPFAWFVRFHNGSTYAFYKTNSYYVRLVRSGQ